jgi:hypothetical protein
MGSPPLGSPVAVAFRAASVVGVRHVFEDLGRPNGYIEGNEGSGAIGVGLRYGDGSLRIKGRHGTTRVYWQGPSIGFDTGGNARACLRLHTICAGPTAFSIAMPALMARPISSAASV